MDVKYGILVEAYRVQAERNAVLRAAVEEMREGGSEMKASLERLGKEQRELESQLRRAREESNTLSFHNKRLESKVAAMQSQRKEDEAAAAESSSWFRGASKSELRKVREGRTVLEEELQAKIQENASLHSQMQDLRRETDAAQASLRRQMDSIAESALRAQTQLQEKLGGEIRAREALAKERDAAVQQLQQQLEALQAQWQHEKQQHAAAATKLQAAEAENQRLRGSVRTLALVDDSSTCSQNGKARPDHWVRLRRLVRSLATTLASLAEGAEAQRTAVLASVVRDRDRGASSEAGVALYEALQRLSGPFGRWKDAIRPLTKSGQSPLEEKATEDTEEWNKDSVAELAEVVAAIAAGLHAVLTARAAFEVDAEAATRVRQADAAVVPALEAVARALHSSASAVHLSLTRGGAPPTALCEALRALASDGVLMRWRKVVEAAGAEPSVSEAQARALSVLVQWTGELASLDQVAWSTGESVSSVSGLVRRCALVPWTPVGRGGDRDRAERAEMQLQTAEAARTGLAAQVAELADQLAEKQGTLDRVLSGLAASSHRGPAAALREMALENPTDRLGGDEILGKDVVNKDQKEEEEEEEEETVGSSPLRSSASVVDGGRLYALTVVDDAGARSDRLRFSMEDRERENAMKEFFMAQILQLKAQLKRADDVAVEAKGRLDSLQTRHASVDKDRAALDARVLAAEAAVAKAREDAELSRTRYEEQIRFLSEHMVELNKTIAAQASQETPPTAASSATPSTAARSASSWFRTK